MRAYKAKNPYIRPMALVKEVAPRIMVDTSGGFLRWGEPMNDMPFTIIETVRRSITGKSCAETFHRYLYGNGFNSPEVAKVFDKTLYAVSGQLARLNGFAMFVKVNGALDVVSVSPIDFENTRLGIPDGDGEVHTIVSNPNMGNQIFYKRSESECYPVFDFDKEKLRAGLLGHIEKYGQPPSGFVWWSGVESEFSRFYPLPFYWGDTTGKGGGLEAMEGDYLLGRLLTKELGTGFLQSVILKMVGDETAPYTEADSTKQADGKAYKTTGDAFKDYLDSNFKGIDGDSMLILWSKVKEQFPELSAFPSNFNYDKLNQVVQTVRSQVATAWCVPLILANIATSGSLSKDDITSAVQLMYGVVRPYQMILERTFQQFVNAMAATNPALVGQTANIENYSPFPENDTVDPLYWAEMTKDERRAWIQKHTEIELGGGATSDTSATNESENPAQAAAQAQLRGSVGGVQGILAIADNFKNGIINEGAATTILVEIFGFGEDIAKKILGSTTV